MIEITGGKWGVRGLCETCETLCKSTGSLDINLAVNMLNKFSIVRTFFLELFAVPSAIWFSASARLYNYIPHMLAAVAFVNACNNSVYSGVRGLCEKSETLCRCLKSLYFFLRDFGYLCETLCKCLNPLVNNLIGKWGMLVVRAGIYIL